MKLNNSVSDTQDKQSLDIVSVVKNILLCYVLTLICFLIFAFIITYTNFPESFVPAIVLIITVMSVILSGVLVARASSSKGWLSGAVSGVVYMVTLYCIGSLAFQSFSFGINFITMLALGLFSGTFGGIVGINLKSNRKFY